MTAYYLRKLIEDKQAQLAWKQSDCTQPITLDNILEQLSHEDPATSVPLDVLDRVVILHQSLSSSYDSDSPQVRDIEGKIYERLGVQWQQASAKKDLSDLPNATSKDLVNQLNALRKKSETLIGPKITHTYLLESRPDSDWCRRFKVPEKGSISFEGNLMERLPEENLKLYISWANAFTEKCLGIIADFDQDNNSNAEESLFSGTPWKL